MYDHEDDDFIVGRRPSIAGSIRAAAAGGGSFSVPKDIHRLIYPHTSASTLRACRACHLVLPVDYFRRHRGCPNCHVKEGDDPLLGPAGSGSRNAPLHDILQITTAHFDGVVGVISQPHKSWVARSIRADRAARIPGMYAMVVHNSDELGDDEERSVLDDMSVAGSGVDGESVAGGGRADLVIPAGFDSSEGGSDEEQQHLERSAKKHKKDKKDKKDKKKKKIFVSREEC
eukprot:PhM_4_TR19058/c0_g1_i3/m.66824